MHLVSMSRLVQRQYKAPHRFVCSVGTVLGIAALAVAGTQNAQATALAPTLTSLSVTSVTTPSPSFTFTVSGTNFVLPARRQHGTEVATEEYGQVEATVNSATQITIKVPALEAVTALETLHFYVTTPGAGRSLAASDIAFTILPPVQGTPPTITSLSVSSVTTPSSATTFTVTGTNFIASTTALPFHTDVVSVEWGELRTTVNSSTQLTVNLPAQRKVTTAVVLHLYVENPDGTQSTTASELTFTINPPTPGVPPTLSALSVVSVTPPVRNFSFTVTGTGFVSGKGERNATQVYSEEYGALDTVVNSATGLTVYLDDLRKTVSTPIVLHLYIQNPDGTRSAAASDIVFTIQ